MDSMRISSIAQTVNNNLAYKADMFKRPNPSYTNNTVDSSDIRSDSNYISPHKKLCRDLQYNNNNNEYISEESDESDSEAPNPYSLALGESGQPLLTSQGPTLDPRQIGVGFEPKEVTPDRKKTKGRLKVEMKYLEDKLKRNTTFNKRKNGMLKKAYELSTLTGTEILVVIASEAGYIHTFATKKLQPVIASQQGQEFIQDCLMGEDDPEADDHDFTDGSGLEQPPSQGGVISKWKASKLRSHGSTGQAQAMPQAEMIPDGAQATVSSPLYGQAAKSEPLYDGVYGQMPSAQPYTNGTAMYGQVLEEKSNSSYSNLSPPPALTQASAPSVNSILQGALSGATSVENYVQQYVSQSQQPSASVSHTNGQRVPSQTVTVPTNGDNPSSVHQANVAAYAYALASQSLAKYAAASSSSSSPLVSSASASLASSSSAAMATSGQHQLPPPATAHTQYTHVHGMGTSTEENRSPQGTSPQEATTDYEFQTDPGKNVYIKVPVKEEPSEVGCYWS